MNLFVIRHGITNSNKLNIFNGHYDEDLNEIGIQQIEQISEKITRETIDLIISSPLLRAKHTSDIISDNKIPIIFDERLIERDMGELTQQSKKLVDERLWNYYQTLNFKNLETISSIYSRITQLIDEIKIKYSNKNILLVTHAFVIRAINIYFYGIPEDGNLKKYSLENGEIKKFIL